jgi:hypothetical protein
MSVARIARAAGPNAGTAGAATANDDHRGACGHRGKNAQHNRKNELPHTTHCGGAVTVTVFATVSDPFAFDTVSVTV